MSSPKAPAALSDESRKLWQRVVREYALEAHHLAILTATCEALDRMRSAQAAIVRDGEYVDGRFGMKAHPGLAVERDSRIAFLRGIRELGLDLEAAATPRPPSRWRQ